MRYSYKQKAQRIIQDYQIVPRAIISSNRDPSDKSLEQTLSMGHKIQQLSYNSSQDSVDVVQYYANFAENETPQIYRYSLWSTLMQVRMLYYNNSPVSRERNECFVF